MPQTPEQKKNDEAEVRVRPELERYMRYQSHHDRAYQRAAAELLKRQKERRLAEIGFVCGSCKIPTIDSGQMALGIAAEQANTVFRCEAVA